MHFNTYLVEDNPVIRDNLVGFLEDVADTTVVAHASTEKEAVKWLRSHGSSARDHARDYASQARDYADYGGRLIAKRAERRARREERRAASAEETTDVFEVAADRE